MFHYVNQLDTNSACLLFGAEKVGFKAFLFKIAARCSRQQH